MKKTLKLTALALALLCMCLCVISCSDPNEDYGSDGYYDGESYDDIHNKLVYDVELSLRAKDVKGAYRLINSKAKALGGYAESIDETYSGGKCTSVSVIYLVPTQSLDELLDYCEVNNQVSYKDVYASQPSETYVNLEARLEVLKEKKASLQALLNDSGTSTSTKADLIEQIAKTTEEIVSLEYNINEIKAGSEYSKLDLYIAEPTSFMDVFLPIFIVLVLPAGIFCVVFFSIRGTKKRNRRLRAEAEAKNSEQQ